MKYLHFLNFLWGFFVSKNEANPNAILHPQRFHTLFPSCVLLDLFFQLWCLLRSSLARRLGSLCLSVFMSLPGRGQPPFACVRVWMWFTGRKLFYCLPLSPSVSPPPHGCTVQKRGPSHKRSLFIMWGAEVLHVTDRRRLMFGGDGCMGCDQIVSVWQCREVLVCNRLP